MSESTLTEHPAAEQAGPTVFPLAGGKSEPSALPPDALAVARGIARLFARATGSGAWPEMPLRKGGRRADLMGMDDKGRIVIVEIKVSRADLSGRCQMDSITLTICDRFYWGVAAFGSTAGPLDGRGVSAGTSAGVIVADGYDGGDRPPGGLTVPLARCAAEKGGRTRSPGWRCDGWCFSGDPECCGSPLRPSTGAIG